MLGPELTHWTIRLALVGFVAAMAMLLRPGRRETFHWYRRFWTGGCCFFLLHVACAFHYFYSWSHTVAVEQTALKTEQLIGLPLGRGVWFSYLFTLIWTADVLWSWLRPEAYRQRSRGYRLAVMGYLCFIAFQGAVVFEQGPVRLAASLATAGLLLLLLADRFLPPSRAAASESRPEEPRQRAADPAQGRISRPMSSR